MNKISIVYSALTLLFGIFLFVYGGYDDSPGAQLLGLLVLIFGIIGVVSLYFVKDDGKMR